MAEKNLCEYRDPCSLSNKLKACVDIDALDINQGDNYSTVLEKIADAIGSGGSGVQSVVAGTNITVDNTDPLNPIVSSTVGVNQRFGVAGEDESVTIPMSFESTSSFNRYYEDGDENSSITEAPDEFEVTTNDDTPGQERSSRLRVSSTSSEIQTLHENGNRAAIETSRENSEANIKLTTNDFVRLLSDATGVYEKEAIDLTGKKLLVLDTTSGNVLLSDITTTSIPVSRGLVSGDSTFAVYSGQNSVASYILTPADILAGSTVNDISFPADTIAQQRVRWTNVIDKLSYDYIIVQVGLNNLASPAATVISELQAYINDIRTSIRTDCKIIIGALTPCKKRLNQISGSSYNYWLLVNEAIMGGGSTPIVNVDLRVNSHVLPLADQYNNLALRFDFLGDGIHENNYGRFIIANGYRLELEHINFLPQGSSTQTLHNAVTYSGTENQFNQIEILGSATLPLTSSFRIGQFGSAWADPGEVFFLQPVAKRVRFAINNQNIFDINPDRTFAGLIDFSAINPTNKLIVAQRSYVDAAIQTPILTVDYGAILSVTTGAQVITTGIGTGTASVDLIPSIPIGALVFVSDLANDASNNNIQIDAGVGSTILKGDGTPPMQTFTIDSSGQSYTLRKMTSNQWMIIGTNQ